MTKEIALTWMGDFNPKSGGTLLHVVGQCVQRRYDTIHLLIHSAGSSDGTPAICVSIYHALRALPVHLITYNAGCCASGANLVFLAGSERYAAPASSFIFHGTAVHVTGGKEGQTKHMYGRELRDILVTVAASDAVSAAVYRERCAGMTPERIEGLQGGNVSMTPEEALAAGVIHGIRHPHFPPDVPLVVASPRYQETMLAPQSYGSTAGTDPTDESKPPAVLGAA